MLIATNSPSPPSFSAPSTAFTLSFPVRSFPLYFPPLISPRRLNSFHYSACSSDRHESPPLLKSAVSGLTELIRIFAPKKRRDDSGVDDAALAGSVDDVVRILSVDYSRAYFLTGNFTSNIYAKDCLFEDPTIKFTGKDQYSQNLDLLVPFFDRPSLILQKIEKGCDNGTDFIIAEWQLSYRKFPPN